MRYLEVKNDENITSINDTDTCLYLKHKVKVTNMFKVTNMLNYKQGEYTKYIATLDSGRACALDFDINMSPNNSYGYVNISIPILDREEGEAYIYVVSSKEKTFSLNVFEEVGINFRVTFRVYYQKGTDVQKMLEQLTFYVYSSKIPKVGNLGMQVFNSDKNLVFNSNKYCLRIIDVVNKIYHAGVEYKKEEFAVPKRQYNTELIGCTLTRTTPVHGNIRIFQAIRLDEKSVEVTVEMYQRGMGTFNVNNYLNLFVCDLSNTQDFPVDVNGHV